MRDATRGAVHTIPKTSRSNELADLHGSECGDRLFVVAAGIDPQFEYRDTWQIKCQIFNFRSRTARTKGPLLANPS